MKCPATTSISDTGRSRLGLALDQEGEKLTEVDAAREHAMIMACNLILRARVSLVRDRYGCPFPDMVGVDITVKLLNAGC